MPWSAACQDPAPETAAHAEALTWPDEPQDVTPSTTLLAEVMPWSAARQKPALSTAVLEMISGNDCRLRTTAVQRWSCLSLPGDLTLHIVFWPIFAMIAVSLNPRKACTYYFWNLSSLNYKMTLFSSHGWRTLTQIVNVPCPYTLSFPCTVPHF